MTSLTRIAIAARKTIRYIIFFIIFLIAGRIVLDAGIAIYKKKFPAPPPAPTIKFGKLTNIPFGENGITTKFNYNLETPEGGLPTNIPTQAKVYFMPKMSSNLLSLENAKATAQNLNFGANMLQISPTVYSFTDLILPTTLQINIVTKNFSISYNLATDQTPLDSKPPISEVATNEFKSILTSASMLPTDLTGPITSKLLRLENGQLVNALSLSESDVIKVNLFRKNYNDLPSVTKIPDQANVWAIISGSKEKNKKVIAAEYHYYPIDEAQNSTYPIKTPAEAFAQLQSGEVFTAAIGQNNDGETVTIRRMYLAYFDPNTVSEFYQPVYVFEGDKGFTAYLPAVTSNYYGN